MSCKTGQTRTEINGLQRGPLNHNLDHLPIHPQRCHLPYQRAHPRTNQQGYGMHVQLNYILNITAQEEDGHSPTGDKSETAVLAALTNDNTNTGKEDEREHDIEKVCSGNIPFADTTQVQELISIRVEKVTWLRRNGGGQSYGTCATS